MSCPPSPTPHPSAPDLPTESPVLSIIILNYNTRDLLVDCIQSIYHETRTSFELIIADNASRDGSVEAVAAQFPAVKICAYATNLGFPEGNNRAIPLALGRYVLLLNPDTIILEAALDRMVAFLDEHPDVGVAGAKMYKADLTPWHYETWKFTPLRYLFHPFVLSSRGDIGDCDVDWVPGACLMIRRSIIAQIGLLDGFMFGEDFDWCVRARQAGWRVYHLGRARIIHIWGASAGTPEKAAWRVFVTRQSKLYYAQKHNGWFFYRRFCGVILAEALVRGALTWVAGRVRTGPRADNWRGQSRGYARLIRTILTGRILGEKP